MLAAIPTGKHAQRVRPLRLKDHATQAKCECHDEPTPFPCPRHEPVAYTTHGSWHR